MAQLLRPANIPPPSSSSTPTAAPRISQLLPSVKCSSCGLPVPLAELGDHVCPPLPVQAQSLPTNPISSAHLSHRMQSRSPSSQGGAPPPQQHIPQQQSPPWSPPEDPFRRLPPQTIPLSPRLRSPAPAAFHGTAPRSPAPSPKPRFAEAKPESPRPDRDRIADASRNKNLPIEHGGPPRSEENAADEFALPNPYGDSAESPQTRPRAQSIVRRDSPMRTRTPSNATAPPTASARPSFERARTPSTSAPRAPFRGQISASSVPPSPTLPHAIPSNARPLHAQPTTSNAKGSFVPFPSSSPQAAGPMYPPSPARTPVPESERHVDTKTGGVAGMAGVGRRGFAAAARAAMSAPSPAPTADNVIGPRRDETGRPLPGGMDGRRANAPKYLDINAAMSQVMRAAATPPLSPNTPYSASPITPSGTATPTIASHGGAHSLAPSRSQSPAHSRSLTPQQIAHTNLHTAKISPSSLAPIVVSSNAVSTRTPSPVTNPFSKHMSDDSDSQPPTPTTAGFAVHLPYFEKYKMRGSGVRDGADLHGGAGVGKGGHRHDESADESDDTGSVYTSKSSGVEDARGDHIGSPQKLRIAKSRPGSEVGLAYADSDSDSGHHDILGAREVGSGHDTPVVLPLSIVKPGVSSPSPSHVRFPTLSDKLSAGSVRKDSTTSTSSSSAGTSSRSTQNSKPYTPSLSSPSLPTPNSAVANLHVGRLRSVSTSTSYSRGTSKSVGALERAMETLIEEGASVSVLATGSLLASVSSSEPSVPAVPVRDLERERHRERNHTTSGSQSTNGSQSQPRSNLSATRGEERTSVFSAKGKNQRSNTVPGPVSPEMKPPKLPTRSRTSPNANAGSAHDERDRSRSVNEERIPKRKERICVRCEKKIEGGRWIQMDEGNVLCERCWKNMYLPKCRRCDLPIEKQAVSSSDGQLKGKYHKDCFNCHVCHKFFPDKTFYVFDGRPFCEYHYHEANDSLCAAPSCGQPIEGPCAVSHSGARYHPEHLLCEFEDGCTERLVEYWEVDGQMLCERHAGAAHQDVRQRGVRSRAGSRSGDVGSGSEGDEGKMTRRMTRFIDLAGTGMGVDDDEIDIR